MDPTPPKRKRRKRDYIAPGFGLAALIIGAVSGLWPRKPLPLPHIPTETERKAELSKVITEGLPMKQGEQILTGLGYDCMRPPAFVVNAALQPLFCSKTEPVREDVEPVHWQVMLRNDASDKISSMTVMQTWKPPKVEK